jgi:hypothetical protein
MTLFTQVRGRLIFRSPYTVSCIGPRYSDESAASNTKDQKAEQYVLCLRIRTLMGRGRVVRSYDPGPRREVWPAWHGCVYKAI